MIEVDANGLSCPMPLMHTKKALESAPDGIRVLVSSGTAKANVENLLNDEGFDVTVEDTDLGWTVTGVRA